MPALWDIVPAEFEQARTVKGLSGKVVLVLVRGFAAGGLLAGQAG